MKILVDADACPSKEIILKEASQFQIEAIFFMDTSHIWQDERGRAVIVGKGKEAVDIALINQVKTRDLVITQDYGLASMVLAKGAICIHPNGFLYTDENIEALLMKRYLNQKDRKEKRRIPKTKKRTKGEDLAFEGLLHHVLKKEQSSKHGGN